MRPPSRRFLVPRPWSQKSTRAASPMATPATIAAATATGDRLFVTVDPTMPPGRRGAIAQSATLAAMVPFADRATAVADLMRLGISPEAISTLAGRG
jgi:hypothetical protein